MENGIRILLLAVVLAGLPGCASVRNWYHQRAQRHAAGAADSQTAADRQTDDTTTPRLVTAAEAAHRTTKVPRTKSSNIELCLDYGMLSIEDFGTHPLYGITAAYHITEDFFFQGEAGRATAGFTSFETLSNINLLTGSERRFTYYD